MRKILSQDKIHAGADEAIADFHPDFVAEVERTVNSNEWVIVGMRQNPVVRGARKYLDSRGAKYAYIEEGSYVSGWKRRLAIKLWSGWPTFPQIFHNGVLIGGLKDLKAYRP